MSLRVSPRPGWDAAFTVGEARWSAPAFQSGHRASARHDAVRLPERLAGKLAPSVVDREGRALSRAVVMADVRLWVEPSKSRVSGA